VDVDSRADRGNGRLQDRKDRKDRKAEVVSKYPTLASMPNFVSPDTFSFPTDLERVWDTFFWKYFGILCAFTH